MDKHHNKRCRSYSCLENSSTKCNIPCRIGWIIGILFLPVLFIPIVLFCMQGYGTKKDYALSQIQSDAFGKIRKN